MTPRKNERRFKPEYAIELIEVAEGDLDSAKILSKGSAKRRENIFYHIEQTVEKSIKAAICSFGIPVPLTHSLAILVSHLPPETKPEFGPEIDELSEFGTTLRYVKGRAILEDSEIEASIELATEILVWAKKIVKNKLNLTNI